VFFSPNKTTSAGLLAAKTINNRYSFRRPLLIPLIAGQEQIQDFGRLVSMKNERDNKGQVFT